VLKYQALFTFSEFLQRDPGRFSVQPAASPIVTMLDLPAAWLPAQAARSTPACTRHRHARAAGRCSLPPCSCRAPPASRSGQPLGRTAMRPRRCALAPRPRAPVATGSTGLRRARADVPRRSLVPPQLRARDSMSS
jgi:hypothetical protein